MDEPKESILDRITGTLFASWWGKFLIGAFLLWCAYSIYGDFCRLEAGEIESFFAPKMVVKTYKILGKWPPVIGTAIIGAVAIGFGIYQLVTGEKDDE